MKKLFQFIIAIGILSQIAPLYSQSDEGSGLPGDHFSLEAALNAFQTSKSLEDFEKAINQESSKVNNLDLNEDGDIDYLRVEDHQDGDVHAIVIQALINEKESQDVAVIEIEKTGNESAILQIIGDEDLYGENIIVEPFAEESEGGEGGPSVSEDIVRVVVNVWLWPSVRWIYAPSYRVYVSPWRWRTYPRWWSPWRPLTWSVFYPFRHPFRTRFHVATTHRVVRAHRVYAPRRVVSPVVVQRNKVVVNNYRVNRGVQKSGQITRSTKVTRVTTPNGTKVTAASRKTQVTKSGASKAQVGGARSRGATYKKSEMSATKKQNGQIKAARKTSSTKAAKSGNRAAVKTKKTNTKVKAKRKN